MRRRGTTRSSLSIAITIAMAIAAGCASDDETFPVSKRRRIELEQKSAVADAVDAVPFDTSNLHTFKMFSVYASPPAGWTQKTNNAGDDRAEHVLWVSPTARTVFGVIFFKMPFPVGHDLAFKYGFLAEAERREGPTNVVDKHWDEDLQGVRFTVDTQKYRCEAKFFVRGSRGWAAYVGTRNDMPYEAAEREQALVARESSEFGEVLKPAPATQPAKD